jgi:ATP-dependent Clp protease protease subunit
MTPSKKKVHRKLYIIGEINEEAFAKFTKQLTYLETLSSKPVEIELYSGGGYSDVAMAFRGRMKASPCELHVHSYGYVASAAGLILLSGNVRTMDKDAWFMVHEDKQAMKGRTTAIEDQVKHARRVENHWNRIYAEETYLTAEQWNEKNKAETYMSAQECLEAGVIEKVTG